MGCVELVILQPNLIAHLHGKGTFSLNEIEYINSTSIWNQGWRIRKSIDLEGEWEQRWNMLVVELRKGHIRLKDEVDSLFGKR